MKIMTFNTQHCLNYIERKIDFDLMAKVILDYDADVVGLNEIRGEGPNPEYTAQTEKLASLTGMKYYYFAPALHLHAGDYGNAILSKYPIVFAEKIMIPDPPVKEVEGGYYETRCVLKAKLDNGITFMVTHFGLNPDEAIRAVKTVVDNAPKDKCVLMGDFNLTPDSPFLAPIREKMKDCADLFTEQKLSYPSDNPDKKIDYIFVSPDIDVIKADIPCVVASDHRPHTATIKVNE